MMAAILNQLSDAQEAFGKKVHEEEFETEVAKETAEGGLVTNWKVGSFGVVGLCAWAL